MNEPIPIEAVAVRPQAENNAVLAVIERAARDPSVDVSKMERLLELAEKVHKRQAEAAFDEAMNAAQGEMRPVARDADNPQTRSRYASYGALDNAVRPIYSSHGFALSFGSRAPVVDRVTVTCHVSHRAGFARDVEIDLPADGKGAKGGDVMTKTHATGSAISYGMRYLLKMIFNISMGEYDDDGNAAGRGAKQPSYPARPPAKPPVAPTQTAKQTTPADLPSRIAKLKAALGEHRVDWAVAFLQGWTVEGSDANSALMPNEGLDALSETQVQWLSAHWPDFLTRLDSFIVEQKDEGQKLTGERGDVGSPGQEFADLPPGIPLPEDQLPGAEAPLPEGAKEIVGYVVALNSKETKKPGKFRFGICIGDSINGQGGLWVNTWSKTEYKFATDFKGQKVRVTYQTGEYGNELLTIAEVA